MTVWLVRHAQPLVAPGICYGASDLPADESATRRAAAALAMVLPERANVVCSPLLRCSQLAFALQPLRPNWVLRFDARLAEMNFGQWEGQRWADIPPAKMTQWTEDFGAWRFGGVESVQQVMDRVNAAWEEARATDGDTVWVTHAGVIRAATLLSQGIRQISQASQWPNDPLPFGEVKCLTGR